MFSNYRNYIPLAGFVLFVIWAIINNLGTDWYVFGIGILFPIFISNAITFFLNYIEFNDYRMYTHSIFAFVMQIAILLIGGFMCKGMVVLFAVVYSIYTIIFDTILLGVTALVRWVSWRLK